MKKELNNFQVVWRMMKLVKPLVLPMCLAIIMGVVGFLCAIGIPVLSAMALFQLVGMYPHLPLSSLLIILLVMALLRGVFHYIEQAANHYIAFKLLAIIRDHVYTALRRLAPAKLDGKDKGNLISLITNDIELLEVFYAHTISPVFIAMITSLILLKFFAHMHILAMFIALIAYLIMAIVIPFYVNHKGKEIGQKNRDEIGNMSTYILESLSGLSTLLQYDIGGLRKQRMLEKNDELETLQRQMKDVESVQVVMSQLLISLFSIIMFIAMFILQQQGIVSVFDTIMATILMLSSFGPVMALSHLANNLLSTLSSGRRVIAILDEKELIKDVVDQPTISFDDIEIDDLNFAYEDEIILKNLNLTLTKNQITGIVGKSGSGKSTLLKLIMRFYDPTSGQISIHDCDLKKINTANMRAMFAYVTQETILFHDTILNNIKIAKLDATDDEIYQACQKASIHDFIMSLPAGYQTQLSELGASLSGGERQRIALARAFLSDAPCILLDEPTSHLDVLNEAIILKSLQQQKDKTMILVTHRESTMRIAQQMIHMNQGRAS
ncbi:MAG: ABC transporter ATP-binding protein [Longibaculum muris]|uniref:ABC-type multidrug transport system fused ATPase/permease subunit n=1 Tax=Longibaculum muris TaxID=1796628 RepID=A0A4R3ZB63_9FIRM|nr:ABC transporter ATP-binding protein [Longibaculum muris]KXU48974.1 ABC transporter, ATP-binding protein [Candidatus Stoquefichus sp. KLE1796]MBS5370917.1 ABC transporter ATP-binding protein [Coprobacillus cateniformis]MCR1886807.1 ABC transporter ATP-binding protein/permease [Longibaculum muris]MED9810534.1 ABC transporter ATP-binding protein [Longibaculum muris]TCW02837.1 ABC-type multidrug transport system fused ATPase/permease subunit [Longibaculum muris]